MVQNHIKQIASLRREIEEKDEAISRFKKDLKDLREQSDELKIAVESRDEEIKVLKKEIDKLKSERQTLETKLRFVQAELEAVRAELEAVRTEVDELKEEKFTMKIEVKNFSKKMDRVTQYLEQRESENSALRKEVKNLREKVVDMASSGPREGMPLPFLSNPVVGKASLVLGELCWQIQAMMYKKVLPDSYDDTASYKVKHIEEDIAVLEDDQQKAEAKERWATLKKQLNWNNLQHTRAMKSIQGIRNDIAQPDLDEQQLVASARLLEQKGKLTGHRSAERVNELIEMWKTLVQSQ